MEKRKFIAGFILITGLILGSIFTNCIYKDYLAYGGEVNSLVLNNKDLYVSSNSLFPYILFKRGKQYGMFFLVGYLLQPQVFLYGSIFCVSFFLGSVLSLQVIQMGMKGVLLVLFGFIPHFFCYGAAAALLFRRNLKNGKKEETSYFYERSFIENHSEIFEILLMIAGCILESYMSPGILSAILKILN